MIELDTKITDGLVSDKTFLQTPSRIQSSIAGAVAVNVGLKIEASPFVPFFILLDVSVRVKGDPYPTVHPAATITVYIETIVI